MERNVNRDRDEVLKRKMSSGTVKERGGDGILIIAEKPSVARQFAAAYNAVSEEPNIYKNEKEKITVTHCLGHLLEAWDAKEYDERLEKWNMEYLPVVPKEIRYKVVPTSAAVLKSVKKCVDNALKRGDEIVIGTDAGREGEVIARLVLKYCKADNYEKLSRFWVSESLADREVVYEGMKKRVSLRNYDKLAKTGIAWKNCDWIFGINMTMLFTLYARSEGWKGKPNVMNVGRVQTAVLNEIYRREKEIENFKPKEYEELIVETKDGIKAYLINKETGEKRFYNVPNEYVLRCEDELKAIKKIKEKDEKGEKESFLRRVLLVKDVSEKREVIKPPLLYNTSDLHKEVYNIYGIEPAKTMGIMQKLYEEGTLSYPRTPSRVLGVGNEKKCLEWYEEIVKNMPEFKDITDRKKYMVENRRLYNNSQLEDHYGLVPLKYKEKGEDDAYKVWNLVMVRFMMQGMKDFEAEKVKVILEKGIYDFEANFRNVREDGWKRYEVRKREKEEKADEDELKVRIEKGQLKEIENWKLVKDKTKPPRLYNYATILAFMQNPNNSNEEKKLVGIGTEATRAAHIKGLEDNNFIVKTKKGLLVEDKGKTLISLIDGTGILKESVRAKETTEWEELGEKDSDLLLKKTIDLVYKSVNEVRGKYKSDVFKEEVMGVCPACGGRVMDGFYLYYCENGRYENKEVKGCRVRIQKNVMGNRIERSDMEEFIESGKTRKFVGVTKDNDKTEFYFVYDEGKKEPQIKIEYEKEELGKCVICGSKVVSGLKSYYCTGKKGNEKCRFYLFKEISGARMTETRVKKLLRGERLELEFMTRDKKKYKSVCYINGNGDFVIN